MRKGDNDQGTFYVAVEDTSALDAMLLRLYDGTFAEFPELSQWRWHVTCIRDSRDRADPYLWEAARDFVLDIDWLVDCVMLMQLEGDRYVALQTWSVGQTEVSRAATLKRSFQK